MIKDTLTKKKSFISAGTAWRFMNLNLRYIVPLFLLLFVNVSQPKAQGEYFWSEQQQIPDYPVNTEEPPFLIADQNNTVHAFNSQPLQLEDESSPKAIFYRQWTKDGGWTNPNDIIYNSAGGGIDVLGVTSNSSGEVFLIFQQDFYNIYFSFANLANAGNSTAWSSPVLIASQTTHVSTGLQIIASIAADDQGNIVVIYSGSDLGKGLYSITSSDGGASWSDPYPVYLTGDETVIVTDPVLFLGQSGNIHAVWTTFLADGSAGAGYYSRLDANTKTWTDPIALDEPGIRTPDVIEYSGKVIVSYYHANVNGDWWRISNDGGNTWSLPSQFSPIHQGTNGRVSFVVDSNNTLYGFFGERINDLNHGMWQVTWTGFSWNDPEPIVKGPQTRDVIGGNGFDPRSARAVIVNGNTALVCWGTDGFAGTNGAWYSYKQLDAPELPAVILQVPTVVSPATPTAIAVATSTEAVLTPVSTFDIKASSPDFAPNPQTSILLGVIPVLVLLIGTIVIYSYVQSKNK